MSPEEFRQLAGQGYNRIPLVREVLADLDTPLSCYLKLARGRYTYLLESVQGGEKWGRYSMIGSACTYCTESQGQSSYSRNSGCVVEEHESEDPLTFVEQFKQRFKVPELEGLPRFNGGLSGLFWLRLCALC